MLLAWKYLKSRLQFTFVRKKNSQNCEFTSVKSTFTSVNSLVIKNYVKLSIAVVRFVEKIEVFKNFFFTHAACRGQFFIR